MMFYVTTNRPHNRDQSGRFKRQWQALTFDKDGQGKEVKMAKARS